MLDPTASDSSRKCAECGSLHTHTSITENGKLYPHWYVNPGKEGTWLCRMCFKNRRHRSNLMTREDMIKLRNMYACIT